MATAKKKRARRTSQGRKTKAKKAIAKREVVYDGYSSMIHQGKNSITEDKAKEYLGWNTDGQGLHCKEVSAIMGEKIFLANDTINVFITRSVLNTLTQEILRGRWRFNGEAIIIGRTGQILNGQHTLLALILAAHAWREHKELYPNWRKEPMIEKAVVFGVSEEDEVVNTMDTCRPRTLTQVLVRAGYFNKMKEGQRRRAGRALDHAIRMLWSKTNSHSNPFGVRRTHSESMAFLEQHPSVTKAVAHVFEEDAGSNKVGRFLSVGYAGACLYLMACSNTDPEAYYTSDSPNEELLDMSCWDAACEFWVELANNADKFKHLRSVIGDIIEEEGASRDERWAAVAKAWPLYLAKKPMTAKAVTPEVEIKDGARKLIDDDVLLGGIDVGDEFSAPNEEEVENGKKEVHRKRAAKKKKKKARTPRMKSDDWSIGDVAWVHHGAGLEPYLAELVSDPYETATGYDVELMDEDGQPCIESVDRLSLSEEV